VREVLDVATVRRWCRLAADALGRTRGEIDALNVFPVPDGDTGTNLHLTLLAAAEAVEALPDGVDAASIWQALAQGALLGARGNSGVILSQVLRGWAEVLSKSDSSGGGEVFSEALEHSSVLARTAVGHPVEGTILSVLDAAAAAGRRASADSTLASVARAAADGARAALALTTGQLEVLARHGVVDAGAAGLCVVLDTLAAVVCDEFPDRYGVPPHVVVAERDAPKEERGPGYEVMYLLDADDEAVPVLRHTLDGLGDSLVVVGGDGLWNVHVHVDDVGAAIEAGLAAGRAHRIRVTYLQAAGQLDGQRQAPCTGRGVIAVTAADGLAELFESSGARVVRREPGTAPPLAVLLEAILSAGDEVAVLPNEPEVLAVAQAAADGARDSGVRIAVVPTKASVQGLAALAVHDPLRRFHDDVIAMTRAAGATRFGHLEIAAHEAFTSVGICQPGDVLGLIEGDVCVIGTELAQVATEVLDRMLSGGGELVTLIPGLAASAELPGILAEHLHVRRPDVEAVIYQGRQELYPLLIGVE
jgi:DAK2 domain fusion protein YloV